MVAFVMLDCLNCCLLRSRLFVGFYWCRCLFGFACCGLLGFSYLFAFFVWLLS